MANRRFEMYQYRQALVRMRQGQSDRQIAATGLMGRRAAGKLRKRAQQFGWLDPTHSLPSDEELAGVQEQPSAQRAHEQSSLHPYRDRITYSSLSRYLRVLANKQPRVTTVLELPPRRSRTSRFRSRARVSRRPHRRGVQDLGLRHGACLEPSPVRRAGPRPKHRDLGIGCHRRAFEHFNGVPGKVIIDNPKCAIIKACYYDPQVQRSYADYAEGYGFLISPCPVADPQKKGRVESGVKYVKNNFFPLRKFRDLADANQQLMDWVMSDAGNRIHATTRTPPLKRFVDTEQALLKPLPNDPPECARWTTAKLHGDCHIKVDNCRYSAPWRLVGESLDVRLSETTARL